MPTRPPVRRRPASGAPGPRQRSLTDALRAIADSSPNFSLASALSVEGRTGVAAMHKTPAPGRHRHQASRRRWRRERQPRMAIGPFLALPWLATASMAGPDGLGVAQIAVAQGPKIVVQLVDQRLAGRDVEPDDLLVRDPVQELDERPQAVAVGHDDDACPRGRRRDPLVPVGQEARHRVLQALGARELGRRQARDSAGADLEARIAFLERRWRGVVGAPPDLDLRRRRISRPSRPCSGPGARRSAARSGARNARPAATSGPAPRAPATAS